MGGFLWEQRKRERERAYCLSLRYDDLVSSNNPYKIYEQMRGIEKETYHCSQWYNIDRTLWSVQVRRHDLKVTDGDVWKLFIFAFPPRARYFTKEDSTGLLWIISQVG